VSGEFRLGLVGCGMLAERGYLPALGRVRGVRLVAVADALPARCAELAPKVPGYSSASELLAAEDPDGLVLATPAAAHLEDARDAARAGVPTLVEKPPAANGLEAAALAGLEPTPWIGFNLRFDRDLQRLRAAVPASSRLALALELCTPPGSWRSYVAADDALLRLGTHLLDLARWLSRSEIVAARAFELTLSRASLELELERGTSSIVCATDRPQPLRIDVRRESGEPVASYTPPGIARRGLRLLRGGGSLVSLLSLQLEAFAQASRAQPQPLLATAVDGLAVMAAVDAARSSAERGGSWRPLEAAAA
jgi:predicted dehydrogenase